MSHLHPPNLPTLPSRLLAEWPLGRVGITEFRTDAGLEAYLELAHRQCEQKHVTHDRADRTEEGSGDRSLTSHFRSGRTLVALRLWFPADAECTDALTAVRDVMGPPVWQDR
jgi:hypothetical protein